jgi:nucleoside-diphosphate-sugar epimerase
MTNPILVTGAAGRVGAVGRTVTELLLKQGKAVRAMVRNEDERAQALRDMGAEVVVGDLLDLDSMLPRRRAGKRITLACPAIGRGRRLSSVRMPGGGPCRYTCHAGSANDAHVA